MVDTILLEKRLRVRTYESLDQLQALLPAWDELLSKFPSATTFSTWEWLTSWWRVYGPRQQLTILGFFNTQNSLAGLAPLCVSTMGVSRRLGVRILKLIGDGTGDSDNLDLPVLPGYEREFVRALLEFLEAQANRWDVCTLNTLPNHSPAGNELLNQLRERGWPHHVLRRPCAAIPLPDNWDSYLSGISSKERGKLNYYSRRLEKHHRVRFYRCGDEERAGCLDALFRLHEMRWSLHGEPGQLRSVARRRFYDELSTLFLARDWLEFWLLDIDGKPAAAQFGFRFRNTVFQLQEAFDPAYASESIGNVLRGYVLKHLITAGVRWYDFLAGAGPDKARWGARVGEYMYVYFSKPHHRGRFSLGLMRGIKQFKEYLRPRLKGKTWQVVAWLKLWILGR